MNPWGYIGTGAMLSLFGGICLAWGLNSTGSFIGLVGFVAAVVGGVLLSIGVIAEGVRIGLRDSETARALDLEHGQP